MGCCSSENSTTGLETDGRRLESCNGNLKCCGKSNNVCSSRTHHDGSEHAELLDSAQGGLVNSQSDHHRDREKCYESKECSDGAERLQNAGKDRSGLDDCRSGSQREEDLDKERSEPEICCREAECDDSTDKESCMESCCGVDKVVEINDCCDETAKESACTKPCCGAREAEDSKVRWEQRTAPSGAVICPCCLRSALSRTGACELAPVCGCRFHADAP